MSFKENYVKAKAATDKAILLIKFGDFYETFHSDAKTVSETLGLTLISRTIDGEKIQMTGFPHYQLDRNIAKLIKAGHRVAVAESADGFRELAAKLDQKAGAKC